MLGGLQVRGCPYMNIEIEFIRNTYGRNCGSLHEGKEESEY